MKSFYILLFASIITFGSIGCRKGADDPFFSIKSRNARIIGKWRLDRANIISTNLSFGRNRNGIMESNLLKYEVTFDGARLTQRVTDSLNGVVIQDDSTSWGYDFTLELKNIGESHYAEFFDYYPAAISYKVLREGDGQWNWANDNVNKDAFFDSGAEASLFGTLGGISNGQIYIHKYPLDRLTDKEMVIKNTTNRIQRDSSSAGIGTIHITTDLTFVFSKVK